MHTYKYDQGAEQQENKLEMLHKRSQVHKHVNKRGSNCCLSFNWFAWKGSRLNSLYSFHEAVDFQLL